MAGQAAASPATGTEPWSPAVSQVLASRHAVGRGFGSVWLGMVCRVADAGLKPVRTMLGVPTGLLAVAPNSGVAGS